MRPPTVARVFRFVLLVLIGLFPAGLSYAHQPPRHMRSIGERWTGSGPHITVRLVGRQAPPGVYPAPLPGAYRVTLPLMPRSVRVTRDIKVPPQDVGVVYLRRGVSRAYRLPVSLIQAETWFQTRFSALGYRTRFVEGSGQGLGELGFSPPSGQNGLQVTVGFQVRHAETVMQYWVLAVAVPPRPHASLIVGPIRSLIAVVQRPDSTNLTVVRISSPEKRKRVIRVVNGLPIEGYTGAVFSCPATLETVTLRITTRAGKRFSVTDGGCGMVHLTWNGPHGRHLTLSSSPAFGQILQSLGIGSR